MRDHKDLRKFTLKVAADARTLQARMRQFIRENEQLVVESEEKIHRAREVLKQANIILKRDVESLRPSATPD